MIEKKHIAGIGVSMALCGAFGIMLGNIVAAFAAVTFRDPIDALATGPTPVPVTQFTTPLGLAPGDIGLSSDAVLVLPAVPVSIDILGVPLSVSGLTVAQVFGGGGAAFGFLLGLYYTVDIVLERRREDGEGKEGGNDPSASSTE